MRLNLGVADCPFWPRGTPGGVNVDIIHTGCEDLRADAIGLPFKAGAFQTLYAHHLVEHLRREALPAALAEWRRVLAYGGVLSLVVPDWRFLFAIHFAPTARLRLEDRDRFLFGHDERRGPYQPHQSAWSAPELVGACLAAGFRSAHECPEATYEPLVARVGWQGCVRAVA